MRGEIRVIKQKMKTRRMMIHDASYVTDYGETTRGKDCLCVTSVTNMCVQYAFQKMSTQMTTFIVVNAHKEQEV